ncbi:helix-turn-helix transcriptional regulator [Phycisphaerales bacterium AB-hyl4]|uniref:Helix-turn-helix transcriptional regulator n=1 Tax=Natronomicrosphaera hydrolytica TaxID=3242702 RepID=A0ABV4U6I7_9BACT
MNQHFQGAPASSGPWMNREQAARHIGVSVRTLDRLNLPRTQPTGSRRVLYHRTAVDEYLLNQCTSQPETSRLPAHDAGPLALDVLTVPRTSRAKASSVSRRQRFLSIATA